MRCMGVKVEEKHQNTTTLNNHKVTVANIDNTHLVALVGRVGPGT